VPRAPNIAMRSGVRKRKSPGSSGTPLVWVPFMHNFQFSFYLRRPDILLLEFCTRTFEFTLRKNSLSAQGVVETPRRCPSPPLHMAYDDRNVSHIHCCAHSHTLSLVSCCRPIAAKSSSPAGLSTLMMMSFIGSHLSRLRLFQ
jgi:hypothetical protein